MYSNNNENYLVANFQQYISSLQDNQPNQSSTNFKSIETKIINPSYQFQIQSGQFYQTSTNFYEISKQMDNYSLWNNNYNLVETLSVNSNNQLYDKSSSVSPSSSIDSSNQYKVISRQNNRKQLQLPSSKAQIDITKCLQNNRKSNPNKVLICSFCKNNGEPENICRSHTLKDIHGRITCPLLKVYKCPICGESGKNAHTITYCKKFKASKRAELLNNLKN